MSRTLKIIFTLSILLNIALLAAGGGMIHKKMKYGYGPERDMRSELSDESRELIRSTFRGAREEFKPKFEEMSEAKARMEGILKAETFDEQAYNNAAKELRDLEYEMSEMKAEKAKDFLTVLPIDDRKAMAEHMARKMAGHSAHKRGHGKYREKFRERLEDRAGQE